MHRFPFGIKVVNNKGMTMKRILGVFSAATAYWTSLMMAREAANSGVANPSEGDELDELEGITLVSGRNPALPSKMRPASLDLSSGRSAPSQDGTSGA